MLPTWATVALALGGSAITGGVAMVAVWIRGRIDRALERERRAHDEEQQIRRLAHEREEQWRERLVRAADDFSTAVSQALLGVHDAIADDEGNRTAAVDEADRRVGEAIARVGRVRLLFGEDTEVAAAANALLPQLSTALSHVRPSIAPVPDASGAWKAIEKAYDQHKTFNRAALDMIGSPRWPVGKSVEMPYRVDASTGPN
jgi:hypothetical protein